VGEENSLTFHLGIVCIITYYLYRIILYVCFVRRTVVVSRCCTLLKELVFFIIKTIIINICIIIIIITISAHVTQVLLHISNITNMSSIQDKLIFVENQPGSLKCTAIGGYPPPVLDIYIGMDM